MEETSSSAPRLQGAVGNPTGGRRPGFSGGRAALLLAAVALGILLRVPALYNSGFDFNSDEAVNALVVKHMLEGREVSFFNWETTYYGVVEGLLAVPFVALFGYEPLAFKLSALIGLAGGMVVRIGGRSRACALLLSCLVIAFGLSKSAAWLVSQNYMTSSLRLVRKHEPLDEVLDLLRREGVRGAFGNYWTAYKATFLSREEIRVASISIWDRNPEMTRAVRALPTAAYIFDASSRHDSAFRERLHDYQIPHTRYLIHPYAVYVSPVGQSLGRAELGPLPRFTSSVAVEGAPQVLRPGESARVKIRVTNTCDSVWSAEGGDGGEYKVTASSRWLGGSSAWPGSPRRD